MPKRSVTPIISVLVGALLAGGGSVVLLTSSMATKVDVRDAVAQERAYVISEVEDVQQDVDRVEANLEATTVLMREAAAADARRDVASARQDVMLENLLEAVTRLAK